jgi:hypothetical protein
MTKGDPNGWAHVESIIPSDRHGCAPAPANPLPTPSGCSSALRMGRGAHDDRRRVRPICAKPSTMPPPRVRCIAYPQHGPDCKGLSSPGSPYRGVEVLLGGLRPEEPRPEATPR